MKRLILMHLVLFVLIIALTAYGKGKGNDTLQLHFIDVGQADGILLISPKGETVLWDGGRPGLCDRAIAYMQQLGIQSLDYLITTHYDADHCGCAKEILNEFPVEIAAYDRGDSNKKETKIFQQYLDAVGNKRETVEKGKTIVLDKGNPDSVIIKVVALNGNGVNTKNENDLSVACVISFDNFNLFLGGDLSGINAGGFADIETGIADDVGRVEIYKVSHHGSKYSSNEQFVRTLKPEVGIISVGTKATGNTYKHPTEVCLGRLHDVGINTFWTEEGEGVKPVPGKDIVGGNIVVEVPHQSNEFTVTYSNNKKETYPMWEPYTISTVVTAPTDPKAKYSWSKKSKVYHYSTCKWVSKISPQNLRTGSEPPEDRTLHKGCPVK
jgi:beta-lactamase superfamily II metal-dependent hydrolase